MVKKKSPKFNPTLLIALVPILTMLAVWFSALSFVPVPWPDDSAFYFVAKELFKWPPHYVMLNQAPFEPLYRIFNFNTMPLFPILIGVGRWFGIDGSFLLKFWSLGGWAASGAILVWVLAKKNLRPWALIITALFIGTDPNLRWASVIVRPEALIGLCGVVLVLGLTFGFPDRFRPRKFSDPFAVILAIAAYLHFNAIHLLFPLVLTLALNRDWKRIFSIGWKTLLYLSPWLILAILYWNIFVAEMSTQFYRLSATNGWLKSPTAFLNALFQSMGSPEPWPGYISLASLGLVILGLIAFAWATLESVRKFNSPKLNSEISLVPAAGWILGCFWLSHNKPEVWFTYYLHLSIATFLGLALLKAQFQAKRYLQWSLAGVAIFPLFIFNQINIEQAIKLGETRSWHWSTYYEFVDCIDRQLTSLEQREGNPKPFQVWCPTFPDVTIELSMRHPDWQLTRTNDFMERAPLAVQHGRDVDAVAVTETISPYDAEIDGPMYNYPRVHSAWMEWQDYFLYQLWKNPQWKPYRHLCQMGRWQAFIYMKN